MLLVESAAATSGASSAATIMARSKRKNRIRTVLRVHAKGRYGPARAEPRFRQCRACSLSSWTQRRRRAARCGELRHAPKANTIGNVAERVGGLRLPNFERLGLGRTTTIRGVAAVDRPAAAVGRLREKSRGKDTITGHWEMAGIVTETPFPTYPDGFPPEVVDAFTAIVGKPPLGNIPASGTKISSAGRGAPADRPADPLHLRRFGVPSRRARGHGAVGDALRLVREARAMLVPPHEVNRVIARPFTGAPGGYARTAHAATCRRTAPVDPRSHRRRRRSHSCRRENL